MSRAAEALQAKLHAAAPHSASSLPTSPSPQRVIPPHRLSAYGSKVGMPSTSAGGGAVPAGTVHMLSRHDLILEDDLPRALEAFLAVDEHRKFRVTLSECDEVFRLLHLKSDKAALLRAKSTAEDSAMVASLRRTGISCQLALEAGARHLIGANGVSSAAGASRAREGGSDPRHPAKPMSAHGGVVLRRSMSRRSSAMFSSSLLSPADAAATTTLSMLSLMRLLFPSYSRRVVEHHVMQLLPPPPALPPQPCADDVRILFRSCRARNGHTDDSDSGTIDFNSLLAACPGASRQELADLFLLHCDEMQDYLLQDLKSFESLRVFDLLSHAGLPANKLVGVRFTPLLSMITLCTHWELLRSQLAEHFSLEEQSRLAHVVVFLHQFGAPAVFQVDWPPLRQGPWADAADATEATAVRFHAHQRTVRGVDGLPRHSIDIARVGLTLHQLAAMLASPKFPPVTPQPFMCPATVEAVRVLTMAMRGVVGHHRRSDSVLSNRSPIPEPAVQDPSLRGTVPRAGSRRPHDAEASATSSAANRQSARCCVPSSRPTTREDSGRSGDNGGQPEAAEDFGSVQNAEFSLLSLSSSSCTPQNGLGPPPRPTAFPSHDDLLRSLNQYSESGTARQGKAAQPTHAASVTDAGRTPRRASSSVSASIAAHDDTNQSTEGEGGVPAVPAAASKGSRGGGCGFPTQSALRLQEAAQKAKDAVRVATTKFRVPFLRVVQSLGVMAYHRRALDASPPSSPERRHHQAFSFSVNESRDGPDAVADMDYVVLTPRPGGISSSAAVRPLSANQRRATPSLHNYSGVPFSSAMHAMSLGTLCADSNTKPFTRPDSIDAAATTPRAPQHPPPSNSARHRVIGSEDALARASSTGVRRDAVVKKKEARV